MTVGNLAPPGVPADSSDARGHRRQIASVLNAVAKKLFVPAAVSTNTAAGDASQAINCTGNAVLIVGYITASAAAANVSLNRGGTPILTLGNALPGQNLLVAWIDTPGIGSFTYSTASGGHTSAASLSVVELK